MASIYNSPSSKWTKDYLVRGNDKDGISAVIDGQGDQEAAKIAMMFIASSGKIKLDELLELLQEKTSHCSGGASLAMATRNGNKVIALIIGSASVHLVSNGKITSYRAPGINEQSVISAGGKVGSKMGIPYLICEKGSLLLGSGIGFCDFKYLVRTGTMLEFDLKEGESIVLTTDGFDHDHPSHREGFIRALVEGKNPIYKGVDNHAALLV